MEVILTQPVRHLGDPDDLVKVKPGYARNYLIPQGFAVLATKGAIKDLEEKNRQASHKKDFLKDQAAALAEKMADIKITITTLAGVDGKLFGSVTPLMIANELKERGFEVDRRKITLDEIRNTGEYKAIVHFHKEVKAEIDVEVLRKED
jgi:large subunit ribosomal protein L9